MNSINWKIRFTTKNKTFLARFVLAVIVPLLAYLGLELKDLTTWGDVGNVCIQFISNPFLLGLTIFNAVNLIPDPTTAGLSDSSNALLYEEPNQRK